MTDEEKKELFIQETVKALMLSELQEQLLRAILDIEKQPIYYIPQRSPIQRVLTSFPEDHPIYARHAWRHFTRTRRKNKGCNEVMKEYDKCME